MKKLSILFVVFLLVGAIACTGGLPGTGGTTTQCFPSDFPVLTDAGGSGAGTTLEGFGGDLTLDQAGNRARVTRNPVILLHGNGGNALSTQWGMTTLKGFLKAAGYNDSEIWAVSYLGATNAAADMSDPHRNNIADVRNFIDAVRTYLGVQKVDIIGHSLGVGMMRSYLLGLQQSGTWDNSQNRLDAVGTLVSLAGANYGLGTASLSEFKTGSTWEVNSHKYNGTVDDTPSGYPTTDQIGSYKGQTALDNSQITYVAFWAIGDFVDAQNSNTGRLVGANINKGYSLGASLTGHEQIIKDQGVFNDLLPYLNMHPNTPQQPVEEPPVVSISPATSTFNGSVIVTVTATNSPTSVEVNTGTGWATYSGPLTITDTTTVQARATNQYGTSTIASVTLTKSPVPAYDTASGTATEHYVAGRLDTAGYLAMGTKYGYVNAFNLYKAEGSSTWTDVQPQ